MNNKTYDLKKVSVYTRKYILMILSLIFFGCKPEMNTNSTNGLKNSKSPNILLIMADDMGYSDLGCYGGEINTPNLDKLAENGLRFTQFYNGARCCPTRASLLTGVSPHLAGMGGMVRHNPAEKEHPYQGYLNTQTVTLAEVLKPVGYRTYMTGKWHVGEFPSSYPLDRGFDRYYGLVSGAMNYWNITKGKRKNIRRTFLEDSTQINDKVKDGFYSTTAYTDKAISYLEDHFSNYKELPFFLYVAHQAPHWPLHAPDSSIAKYRGKYLKGWDVLRKERYQRMLDMGLVSQEHPLPELDSDTQDWENLSTAEKDSMDLKMATYAAMVDVMDENIGRLLKTLKEKGELDNTLVIFLSDNGASYEFGALGRNFRPDLTGKLGSENSYYSYGSSWANASNTPYQKFKRYTYEGGIATPLIASWGDKIINKGKLTSTLGHITDVMATIVDVSGAHYPEVVNKRTIHPMEGKSLLPVLNGTQKRLRTENDPLIWEHEGNKAVRAGDWKLVKLITDTEWKLFNLKTDRTELNNLALSHPNIVNELKYSYLSWSKKVGVIESKNEKK